MSIHIDRIAAQHLGPIQSIDLSLGRVNVIYGQNEQGKTFLVEFLLRTLFQNHSYWYLRSESGRGRVTISGLKQTPIDFLPSSNLKLDTYLQEHVEGLPPRLSQLLVIKGGELGFLDRGPKEINRAILKEFLSGQALVDQIEQRIQPTVRQATILNGVIDGHRRGELKNRLTTQQSLHQIDDLFERIDIVYSAAGRREIQATLEELQRQQTELLWAKNHYAYNLAQEIDQLKENSEKLSIEQVLQLRERLAQLQTDADKLSRQQKRQQEQATQSQHYSWLEEAITVYEQRGGEGSLTANPGLLVGTVMGLIVAVLFSFVGRPIGPIVVVIAILLAALLGFLYLRQMRSALSNWADVTEINQLKNEFLKRFGQPLTGLPLMQQLRKSMERDFYGVQTLEKEIAEAKEAWNAQKVAISADLRRFAGESVTVDLWQEKIDALLHQAQATIKTRHAKENELTGLMVPVTAYRSEPAPVTFNADKLNKVTTQIAQLQQELETEKKALDNLKQAVCHETQAPISTPWETVIEHLQKHRQEVAKEYQQQTSGILSQILLSQVLGEVRLQEDDKIRRNLTAASASAPFAQVTGHYNRVHLENDQLVIADDYGEFPLSSLSTGVREQILLSLRLGIASHLFGNQTLFLLLDDAFQHSDWKRREQLVAHMIKLAYKGWQIIYFTMDNHIRDLFKQYAATEFGRDYCSFDLADVYAAD